VHQGAVYRLLRALKRVTESIGAAKTGISVHGCREQEIEVDTWPVPVGRAEFIRELQVLDMSPVRL
jgi:hypothetical protein